MKQKPWTQQINAYIYVLLYYNYINIEKFRTIFIFAFLIDTNVSVTIWILHKSGLGTNILTEQRNCKFFFKLLQRYARMI